MTCWLLLPRALGFHGGTGPAAPASSAARMLGSRGGTRPGAPASPSGWCGQLFPASQCPGGSCLADSAWSPAGFRKTQLHVWDSSPALGCGVSVHLRAGGPTHRLPLQVHPRAWGPLGTWHLACKATCPPDAATSDQCCVEEAKGGPWETRLQQYKEKKLALFCKSVFLFLFFVTLETKKNKERKEKN